MCKKLFKYRPSKVLAIIVAVLIGSLSLMPCVVSAATFSDDFNRANGGLGSNWTNQLNTMGIQDGKACAATALQRCAATYNGVSASVVEGDIEFSGDGASNQTVGFLMNYLDNANTFNIEFQGGIETPNFYAVIFYEGLTPGTNIGAVRLLASEIFTSAHIKAELVNGSITVTFSNVNGGSKTVRPQSLDVSSHLSSKGTGVGITGLGPSTIDNFSTSGTTNTIRSELFPIGPDPIPNANQYRVDVATQNLGSDSWRFTYTIYNDTQGSGNYSGFDGFRILIPEYSEPYNITLPASYLGLPGYWETNSWGYGDGVYDVFQFWGQKEESVYPAGTSVEISFDIDGVAVGENFAALVSYFDEYRDEPLDDRYINYYITLTSPIPLPASQILEFYQDSIGYGSLQGTSNKNQEKLQREKAFGNMLQNAVNLIAHGDTAGAVQQLWSCYYKVDSNPNPPDFIAGVEGTRELLANMILVLINDLGSDR